MPETNLLKVKYPEIFKQIDVERTLQEYPDLDIENITCGCHKKLWYRCEKGHTYKCSVQHRTSKNPRSCPYCRNKKILSGYNDLQTRFPKIANEFASDLNNITPNKVFPGSHKEYYWRCSKNSEHIWKAPVNSRTNSHHNSGCPFCANKQVLSGYNDLKTVYPEIAKEFAEDLNNITPDKVLFGSDKKYYWRCYKNNNHIWKTSARKRTLYTSGCPYCSNHKVLSGFNDLQTKFPDIAKEFASDLNNINPEKVIAGSNKKYYWRCSKNPEHVWLSTVNNRTSLKNGCPYCNNKHSIPELIMYELCKKYIDSFTLSGAKINNWEIDIYIPALLYCVEYDGIFFHNSDIVKDRELRKNKAILTDKNNYKLFRIKETNDVNKLKLFKENIDGVSVYYISNIQNKNYFECYSKIFNDIFKIKVNFNEIKDLYKQIKSRR